MSDNTYNDTGSAGQQAGEKVKGGLDVFHGAGETLRGNFNSIVDGAGDAIAGRSTEQGQAHARSAESSDSVANKGLAELKSGLDALSSKKGQ